MAAETKQYEPHQQRVVDEHRELGEKLSKLNAFLASSPIFASLDKVDRNLLEIQQSLMESYHKILWHRICRF